jgi:hypothetical protein
MPMKGWVPVILVAVLGGCVERDAQRMMAKPVRTQMAMRSTVTASAAPAAPSSNSAPALRSLPSAPQRAHLDTPRDWLASFGGADEQRVEEVARAIAIDPDGRIYVVGTVSPQADFLSTGRSGALRYQGHGGTDAFLALVDGSGALRWAQIIGGPSEDYAYDVVTDGDGGAWVCGTFKDTIAIGPHRFVAVGAEANGFAFRVSFNGAISRALHLGPAPGVIPGECAVDAENRLYVSGSYLGAPSFAGSPLPEAPAGRTAGFAAAFERDGRLRWVRTMVADSGAAWRGIAIAEDGSGAVLGVGQFRGRMPFGATALDGSGGAGASTWIARWSSDGEPNWAISPAGESYGRGLRALGADIVVSGAFRSSLQWPATGASVPAIVSAGGQDLYAARLDANGVTLWARAIGSTADDEGAEIAADAAQTIYLGGSLAGIARIGATMLEPAGGRDILVARLRSDGSVLDGRTIGGVGDDVGYAIEASSDGVIAYAGVGRGAIDDGVRGIGATGAYDAVFGRLGSVPTPAAALSTTVSTSATIPQRGGGSLGARIYAPNSGGARYPVVSLLPGGGAPIDSVFWAAEGLAARGYVVVVTQPSSGGSLNAYHLAAISGIDFLASASNPYAAISDTSCVGVAGWSLGARALARTQEEDARVDALVAWDNLAVYETGDPGSPNCVGALPSALRAPRVPAMGQASDYCGPPNETPEDKKFAYQHWRAYAQPTMQVVLAASDHFVWGS